MRKLAMAMVVSGALGSSFANALGLGEIKMNSALNQPLDADVKLLNVGDLSKNEILPNLASHKDFSRAGVERVFFLTGIKFDVELDGKGGAVLHLSTDRIVREPYLNFLIELHWPSGRLLREYTTLLDPPLFSEAPPSPVQQAATAAPAKVESTPQPTTYSAPSYSVPAPVVTQSSVQSTPTSATALSREKRDGTVLVKKNDTLWGIAKENRPDRSVTVRQTMMAIQQHNPDAFIRNNINLLKSGQVLRIPAVEEIRKVSSSQASVEMARQNQEWQSKKTIDGTQNYDSASSDGAGSGVDQGGLLKLVATDAESVAEELSASASGGSADGEATGSGSQAGSDFSEQGSASAIVNVENLEQELQDLQRLMTLKQEQLALLQATQVEQAMVESEAQSVAAKAVDSEAQTAITLDEAAEVAIQDDAAEVAQIEEAAAQEPRPEESILDILTNNPLYIGVMIVVILGALILLGAISRRRNEEKEYPQDLQQAIDTSGNEVELPDEIEDEWVNVDSVDSVDEMAAVSALADAEPLMEAVDAEVESDDSRKLLEEADIYIAYGRYERAVEILQPAVNSAPENTALRLKLAEIFLANNDEASFSQQEGDLQAIADADALAKLGELKAKYADSLAAETASQEMPEEISFGEDYAADVAESDKETAEVAQNKELEYLEFELPELDTDATNESDVSTKSEENLVEFITDSGDEFFDIDAGASNEDNSLEFSLDEVVDQVDETQKSSGYNADDLDFLVDTDESATKLELAKAYIDMADAEAAQEILNEVVSEGSDEQQHEAKKLLENLV